MPFEYGGQTWPDTTVVSEKFDVTFAEGGTDPEFPRVSYKLCFKSFREGSPEYTCAHLRGIKPTEQGKLQGTLMLMREGGTQTDAYLVATHSRALDPNPMVIRDWTPEQQAYAAEVRVSNPSDHFTMPQAKAHVVPEPGMVLMLAIGLLGLAVAGWRRKTR